MANQGEGVAVACIGPGSNINLFVQPFPQYLIKVGYRVGGRGAGVVVCIELKYVRIM